MHGSLVRRALRPLLITALTVTALGAAPGPSLAVDADACVDGFDRVEASPLVIAEDITGITAAKSLLAGGVHRSDGWAARIARVDASGWQASATKAPLPVSGFVAIDGTPQTGLWAVGFKRAGDSVRPYAVRRADDGSWRARATPREGSHSAALTDVAVRRKSAAWAVGFKLDKLGSQRPYALRWNGKRWSPTSPVVGAAQNGLLTSVWSSAAGGTWAAGSLTNDRVERPYIVRRANGRWRRQPLPWVGAGSLAAIVVHGQKAGWAAGYRVTDHGLRPLLLRWDGRSWKQASAPDFGDEAVLFDVSVATGAITVAGAAWHAASRTMRPVLAQRDGSSWSIHTLKAFGSDAVMTGLDGDPLADGLAVARDLSSGVLAHACTGSSGPSIAKSVRKDRRAEVARASDSEDPGRHTETLPPPRTGLAGAPALRLSAAPDVRIVDTAASVGLPVAGHTYGAVVRDFDGNGRKDVFIGGHGDAAALYLWRDGGFERSSTTFGIADRHGCAASDVDRSGLPDLYCTFGGARGLGVKANELWLDPGGPTPRRAEDSGGAKEVLGRGRVATFFDYDSDGRKDLVVGQTPNRVDGLPSLNRVYRWAGAGQLKAVRDSGISPAIGARAFDSADFDRDGRTDLLMVAFDAMADPMARIKLYRNTKSGLKAVHAQRGIRTIGERDAELVGLDDDAWPDLVQLSGNRIRISLQRDGQFKNVYERRLSYAVAVAAGDADGDGDMDLYVLRTKVKPSDTDIILFNDGNGRSYTAVAAPNRSGGRADDVLPIDHDNNGLMDFLVLNGRSSAEGPIELISFFPA